MIAALHQRTEAYKLLVDLYGADPEVRDYSGKKARNYFEPAWAPKEDLYQQYPEELEDIYNRYVLKYRIPIISVQPLYSINKLQPTANPRRHRSRHFSTQSTICPENTLQKLFILSGFIEVIRT